MASRLTVHFDRRPGGLGKVTCREGFRLLKGTLLPDRTDPCPLCNSTEAAKRATALALLGFMLPPKFAKPLIETPKVASPVNRSDADRDAIDTTGFHVVKVPEGVVPRRNAAGDGFVHRNGQVVMDTIDFRSDKAVSARLAGGMSKWGKGRVTGSTSVCSTWAVPARPGSDAMANSSDVLKDLRSGDMADTASQQRNTPRRGARQVQKPIRVRQYTV